MDEYKKRSRNCIDRAVISSETKPVYYTVSGSHIYGFHSEEYSDIDIRGFHIADGDRYTKLDQPKEQIIINQGNTTQGFEDMEDIELVSYELRKFGKLLYGMNFNILEWLYNGEEVCNFMDEARKDILLYIIKDKLPADVPYHYRGMAKHNYNKYLNPDKDAYKPFAKKYLYVLRGLLAAKYVTEQKEIEANIKKLAKAQLDNKGVEIVSDLINWKLERGDEVVGAQLRDEAGNLIEQLFDETDINYLNPDKDSVRKQIDLWMDSVRQNQSKPF